MTALLAFGTFVLLFAADYLVRWMKGPALSASLEAGTDYLSGLRLSDLRLPQGIFFHPGHSWATLQPDGTVRVGFDDFLGKLAGPIDKIHAPATANRVRQGEPLLQLQIGERTMGIPSPVSGKVARINPDLLKGDPIKRMDTLDQEWVAVLEPSHLADELGRLSVATQAKQWLKAEIDQLGEFLQTQLQHAEPVGATLTDGGEPAEGMLRDLDEQGWTEFQEAFLN